MRLAWKIALGPSLGISLLGLSVAHAALPPLAKAKLEAKANLIVDVESLQVLCKGPPVEVDDVIEQRYRSQLKIVRSHKNAPPKIVWLEGIVRTSAKGTPRRGKLPPPVLAQGWVGRLYLKRTGPGESFELVHPSGAIPDQTESKPKPLPSCAP